MKSIKWEMNIEWKLGNENNEMIFQKINNIQQLNNLISREFRTINLD